MESVDLHGHKLTITPCIQLYFGSGSTFTDSLPTGEGGELHVFMPKDVNMSTDRNTGGNFTLTGSLQLVKEGEGMFTILAKNTYTGGTVVNGGTLRAYNDTMATYYALHTYHDFGAQNTTITVNSNGVFDVHGVYEVAQYHIILNGGTFTSSLVNKSDARGMEAYGNGVIGAFSLTADSKIAIPGSHNGSGHVIIAGKYTPVSDYVYNMTLADGATLNLSDQATLPWTWLPLGTVAGATYNVELPEGVRLKSGDRVIEWDKQTTFDRVRFMAAKDVKGSLKVEEDGLYLRRGCIILIR